MQPPLNYRYVPLLPVMTIAGVRSKSEVMALEYPESVLVIAEPPLGKEVYAFVAPDDSMVPPTIQAAYIADGEQAVIATQVEAKPGDSVCAILFKPTRILLRKFGVVRAQDPAGDQPDIIRLVALNPLFADEFIRSPADGFVFGVVGRVQSVRYLSRSRAY